MRREVEHLAQGESFHGIEWYLPYFYDQPATLLDYLPKDGLLVIDDAAELLDTLRDLEAQAEGLRTELERTGELPRGFAAGSFGQAALRERLQQTQPIILGLGDLDGTSRSANTPLARSFAPGPRYGGKTKEIVTRRRGAA